VLGDRGRMMDSALDSGVVMRSMATRGMLGGVSAAVGAAARIMAAHGCRIVIIETVGVGQSEIDIARLADLTVLVMAPGLGDDIQAMKAGLLEVVDLIVVNKSDLPGAEAAAMEFEAMLRDGGNSGQAGGVLLTNARTGSGVDRLFGELLALDGQHRQSGRHAEVRCAAFEHELTSWAMMILKERLSRAVAGAEIGERANPRAAAVELVGRMIARDG